ncbi:energy transducer TonB [Parabacteroides sp. FAFU027]|uniref:energy transducer TonB n=1 Tax=Parabacteroides sp. FAFU027 TaxID=2922715 RepID=UPI001FAF6C88|nr:energy transducer TonB [Parabacteroides sp. FAFU027]
MENTKLFIQKQIIKCLASFYNLLNSITVNRTLSPLVKLKIAIGITLLTAKAAEAQMIRTPNPPIIPETLNLSHLDEELTGNMCYGIVVTHKKTHYASFKGGDKALNKFIYDHLKYPERALDAEVSGDVAVNITIGKDGSVIKSQVIQRQGFDLDEEALRLVSLLPKFHPGKVNGKKGETNKTIIIHFELPKSTPIDENK